MRRETKAATVGTTPTLAERFSPEEKKKSGVSKFLEYLKIFFVAFVVVFGFIRPFIIEPYKIPSGSMEDTLLVGDRVLVVKFLYGVKLPGTHRRLFAFRHPKPGDIFVFSPRHSPRTHFIKRVVAVEGDTVETRGKTLIVNGKPLLNEPYVKHMDRYLPDFPPFQMPLVPYFLETPSVAKATMDSVQRYKVEEVQVRDGLPVALRLANRPQFLVRVHEYQPELFAQSSVNEYFWIDADNGQEVLRGLLYQNRDLSRWYLVEGIPQEAYAAKFPEGKPFVVPRNHFFAMGDNRENSADSRAWGPVPFDAVKGKAVLVYWSTGGDGRIRWNRLGMVIRSPYGDTTP